MSTATTPTAVPADRIDDLIASAKPGYTLPQPFYNDPAVFERDMERLLFRQWLFVGHVSQIPKPGDYVLFQVGLESIILIRGKAGEVFAHFNCRHRESPSRQPRDQLAL